MIDARARFLLREERLETKTVDGMIIVEEQNQDDLSRIAGCYLYTGTKIWIEDGSAHRDDGPAVIFPDGVVRWYIRGKEITRAVNTFFYDQKWPIPTGLDTAEKLALFREKFILTL